jgi:hypothetical protein
MADSNATIGKGTQPGTVLWEMLTKLFNFAFDQRVREVNNRKATFSP